MTTLVTVGPVKEIKNTPGGCGGDISWFVNVQCDKMIILNTF